MRDPSLSPLFPWWLSIQTRMRESPTSHLGWNLRRWWEGLSDIKPVPWRGTRRHVDKQTCCLNDCVISEAGLNFGYHLHLPSWSLVSTKGRRSTLSKLVHTSLIQHYIYFIKGFAFRQSIHFPKQTWRRTWKLNTECRAEIQNLNFKLIYNLI